MRIGAVIKGKNRCLTSWPPNVRDDSPYVTRLSKFGARMRSCWFFGLLFVVGCDDSLMAIEVNDTATEVGSDYCAVQGIFASHCIDCHSASAALGGLDLESDAYDALVGVQAEIDAKAILVVAGDPSQSLLHTKMSGTQADNQGGVMPSTGQLDALYIDAVGAWITAGATESCD